MGFMGLQFKRDGVRVIRRVAIVLAGCNLTRDTLLLRTLRKRQGICKLGSPSVPNIQHLRLSTDATGRLASLLAQDINSRNYAGKVFPTEHSNDISFQAPSEQRVRK